MSFETSSIGKYTFNLQGKDELLWAANGKDAYVEWHGPAARGRFAIDWPTGKLTFHDHNGHDHGSQDHSSASSLSLVACALVAMTITTFLG